MSFYKKRMAHKTASRRKPSATDGVASRPATSRAAKLSAKASTKPAPVAKVARKAKAAAPYHHGDL
ncbi:MAG: hypothetical protein J0H25_07080, partial [Rhizobiales bacterium]|nr:hypothetical protein [Hyphomicrobiales bacterium]